MSSRRFTDRNMSPLLFPNGNGSLHHLKDSTDENLDLFSKGIRNFSVSSPDNFDVVSIKLGRLSTGSAKQWKGGFDDLLTSNDGGNHDYDWLLTPPGTPLVPLSDGNEHKPDHKAPRRSPLVRSTSTNKVSRLSISQLDTNHVAKPARSSSATRSSISSSQHRSYSSQSTSILNTSSALVSSYIRPSTPTNRNSVITRPSTPSARSTVSRTTTPSKSRCSSTTSSMDKQRLSQNSRPSTPTRTQISGNINSSAARIALKPSTPTRRNPSPSISPISGPPTPSGHNLPNGRTVTSSSRPNSPGPRGQPTQTFMIPDFPLETPPNLRTTLTERSISAGRSRPGLVSSTKGNTEPLANNAVASRRQSSPVVSRGRLTDSNTGLTTVNGKLNNNAMDSRRELSTRKPVKISTDNCGFGRMISKRTPDIVAPSMDMKNSSNVVRVRTGSNLFPQSILSANNKSHPITASVNGHMPCYNVDASRNGNRVNQFSETGYEEDKYRPSAKLGNIDIYESSRYDLILLKEDPKNTYWLHSIDDKSDDGPFFDNEFEYLPEPFDHQ